MNVRAEHRTDSVLNARDDARAQAGLSSEWMPYLPASSSPYVPTGVDAGGLTWAETVAPGGYTHKVLARGTRLRLDDPTGQACAHLLLYNALEPVERLNVADTLKIPWQAYLRAGTPLLSGDGRVLASLVEDSSGRHDAFCGTTTEAWNASKYGDARPEGPSPAGRSLFLKAAAKHGLTRRDLPPSVSFFQGIRVARSSATSPRPAPSRRSMTSSAWGSRCSTGTWTGSAASSTATWDSPTPTGRRSRRWSAGRC